MRKTTKQIASALKNNVSKRTKNTVCTGTSVLLFGNVIARIEDGALQVTLAGWPTTTTRERLNGILAEFGSSKRLRQSRGNQFFGDRIIGASEWVTVCDVLDEDREEASAKAIHDRLAGTPTV